METTQIKKQEKQKETSPESYEEYFERIAEILHDIKGVRDEHQKDEIRGIISDALKDTLNQDRFFAKIHIGVMDFHERSKRRSTRKPITTKRLLNLTEDLHTLCSTLKI